jgi:uncharacterized membrane protein
MKEKEIPKNFKELTKGKKPNELPEMPKDHFTFGQRAADRMAIMAGSWTFILAVLGYIAVWITLNIVGLVFVWDPWPFIILNLTLSCLAALQAPVILMSQNRQGEKDRLNQRYDYLVDRKTSRDVSQIQKQLVSIKNKLDKMDCKMK